MEDVEPLVGADAVLSGGEDARRPALRLLLLPDERVAGQVAHYARDQRVVSLEHVQLRQDAVTQTRQT